MFPYRPALLAAAALVAVSPVASAFAQDAPAKEYDLKAEALLQRAADRLKAAQSFSGQVEVISNYPATDKAPARELRSVRTFRLQKPNLVFQEQGKKTKGSSGIWLTETQAKSVSDGKTGVMLLTGTKTYQKMGVKPEEIADSYGLNFGEFFDPTGSDVEQARSGKKSGRLVSLKVAQDATFGGVPCAVVEEQTLLGKTQKGTTAYRTTKIYVGKKDDVIRGYHTETPMASGDGSVQTADTIVTNVVVGDKIPASVFAVDLTGYKEYVEPKLLTAGMVAPDFTAYDKAGKAIKLSDLKGKVVVLDFWATWCGPCMASLPHTTEVAKKTADKGVVVFAVNVWDTKAAYDKWLPAHPEFSALTFAIDTTPGQGQDVATKLYNVSGIPTQYVIDRNGKVVTSFVGYNGPTDALEKAIAKADTGMAVAQK